MRLWEWGFKSVRINLIVCGGCGFFVGGEDVVEVGVSILLLVWMDVEGVFFYVLGVF